jgi:hypothetical protein
VPTITGASGAGEVGLIASASEPPKALIVAESEHVHAACSSGKHRRIVGASGRVYDFCAHGLRLQRLMSGAGAIVAGMISTGVGEATLPPLVRRSRFPVPIAAACRRAKLNPARSATCQDARTTQPPSPTLARFFRGRHDLVVENLLLRQQLHIALRRHCPRLKTRDQFLWLVVRSLYPDWKRRLILIRPETVVRWHGRGWRLYWRWRSRHHLGRPRYSGN